MARPYGVDKEPVNVRLPKILAGRIRTTCKARGISFTELIETAVRAYLDGQEPVSEWGKAVVARTEVHTNSVRKPPAKELVARFAGLGVTTAAQLETQEGLAQPTVIQVGNCPVEDVAPRHNWVKLYAEMQEMEPAEAEYAFSQATTEVKLPHGFRRQPPAKQVQWLQANA